MRVNSRLSTLLLHRFCTICSVPIAIAFVTKTSWNHNQRIHQRSLNNRNTHFGWLENFFEPNKSSSSTSKSREVEYPEQYPATYEINGVKLPEDASFAEAALVRPLLKNTQLSERPLQLVYDANRDGWDANSFHRAVDGKGAAVILATDRNGKLCGGYNPKGYASLGGARPSVAAFLFYQTKDGGFQKLRKVGGGGLACARDDPGYGISFGPDALVIGLQAGREKLAASKLGPYFERGPEGLSSLFEYSGGSAIQLTELKVLVGSYEEGEEIPYSGGVLDMTSCHLMAFQKVDKSMHQPSSTALSMASNDDHHSVEASVMNEITEFSQELADSASDAIMPYWRQSVKVESKEEKGRSLSQTVSPVTIADRSAELAMRNLIESRFPSHGIYGEEYGQVRTDADFVWVLDPIDGTKAFITGKPTWGTLIGCLYRGVPIVGVIDHCILKERWVGRTGGNTILNGKEVSVSNVSVENLCDATIYTTTPDMFRAGEELEKFEAVRDASLRTLYGCDCYAYALVASGFGADAVVEADLGLYDYAAIVPVVQGAGGIITDWQGNSLTLQNHDNSKGRVVACSNTELHSEILSTLNAPLATAHQRSRGKRSVLRYALTLISGIVIGAIGIPRNFI